MKAASDSLQIPSWTDTAQGVNSRYLRLGVARCTYGQRGKLSVALTPDMVAGVRAAVEAGDCSSVSEVVRDALRDWRLRRRIETLQTEELRRLVQQGIDSGAGLDADVVFGKLRMRFERPATE